MPIDVTNLTPPRPRKTGPRFVRDVIVGGTVFVIAGAVILTAAATALGFATVVFVKVLRWGGVL